MSPLASLLQIRPLQRWASQDSLFFFFGQFFNNQALHNGAAPSFQLFNRFTVKGSNTEFNIDAASAKRDVNDVGVGIFSRACDGISLGSDVAPATDVFDGTTDVFARSSSDFA